MILYFYLPGIVNPRLSIFGFKILIINTSRITNPVGRGFPTCLPAWRHRIKTVENIALMRSLDYTRDDRFAQTI